MILRLSLLISLLLSACGYHLVGQGKSTVIPEGVSSATLVASSGSEAGALFPELIFLWQRNQALPQLTADQTAENHVTLRIEQAGTEFIPIAYDANGLASHYRLQISGRLNMYQHSGLIWQSGVISVHANVFGDSNPSVIEAERERLTEQLRQRWAKEALNRLLSGF